jgi:peptidoglycan/LPS O-acetylase OafA/YrhL
MLSRPAGAAGVYDADAIEAAFRGRIGGLDFVRALAVSLVFLGHATEGRSGYLWVFGGLGSTTLFVVSGFLTTWLLLREHTAHDAVNLHAYYLRRSARLLPALYLYLSVALGLQLVAERPVPWEPVLASVLHLTNYYQAFTGAETNIASHLWALAMQAQFYVLWPVVAVALLRRGHRLSYALGGAIAAIWCWRWLLIASDRGAVEYLYRALETRGDALAVGGLLAILVRSPRGRASLARLISVSWLPWLLLVTLVAVNGAGMLNPTLRFAGVLVVEPPILALLVLFVVTAARTPGIVARVVTNRLAVQIGQVSYGFYLFHGLIGYTTVRVVDHYTGSLALAVASAYVAVVVFATALSRYFETPVRRWLIRSRRATLQSHQESHVVA